MLDAFKLVGAAVLDYKEARHEFMHCGGDQDRIGFCRRLKARSDVGCITEHVCSLTPALAHDHRAGLDPNPNGQHHLVLSGQASVQRTYLVHDSQASADRALSVVLVRFRPTEVNHQPVAEILGDVTSKTGDSCCCGFLIPGGDIAPVFRIEMSCDLSRVD